MKTDTITIGSFRLPLITVQTAIVGSGAASLNAAVWLDRFGVKDTLILTERMGGGTSNNTGSDKQTYYKLSVSGGGADSPQEMAKSLFDGGSMHGDLALVEATLSPQSFFNLVSLGVPFPHDRMGGYVGYKTDHDPRQRATSAGPKTSMLMFQPLAAEVERRKLSVMDNVEVVAILTAPDAGNTPATRCVGLLCMDRSKLSEPTRGLFVVNAVNVVYGTGGPAVLYQYSVYPDVHTGATGIAFEAGATGQNLTEWQYGLASTKFRWNVSGTYQQVIPRYISTAPDGSDEREFLNPYFDSMRTLTRDIFLKGYQWPFDPRKVRDFGSSIVDILVYHETIVRGRRVFMDFRHNPSSTGNAKLGEFAFDDLDPEVHTYLKNSHALLSTPIERLMKMNPPAIDLYREHGIDITKEPLEVAVCAQHNNGGLKGNLWWESDLKHLFPVGEVNGSHGVYRPGGSALNSGQCGSLRAAQFISKRYTQTAPDATTFAGTVAGQVTAKMEMINGVMAGQPRLQTPQPCHPCADSACTCVPSAAMSASTPAAAALVEYRQTLQRRMSSAGAHLRKLATVKEALTQARQQLAQWSKCKADDPAQLPYALKNRDAIIAQIVYLAAMEEYLAKGGVSRGSYMVLDTAGELPCAGLGDEFRFALGEDDLKDKVLEASYNAASTSVTTAWTPRRPVPPDEGWYENVWADFREDRIVRE